MQTHSPELGTTIQRTSTENQLPKLLKIQSSKLLTIKHLDITTMAKGLDSCRDRDDQTNPPVL